MDTPQHGSILPEGMNPEGLDIKKQAAHRYAAIHIEQPFDNPFSTIPGAYHTLGDYMRTNGLYMWKMKSYHVLKQPEKAWTSIWLASEETSMK